jgi:cytochrome P450
MPVPRPTIPTELIAPLFAPATFARPEVIDDLLERLRRDYPLAVAEVPGFDPHWIVTRYRDIQEISRRDDIFHSADRSKTLVNQGGEALMRAYSGGAPHIFQTLVQMDPPMHTAYRAVTEPAFAPKAVGPMADNIRTIARSYVDKMAALAPNCDFAKDIAFSYPAHVVLGLIGVPEEDHPRLVELTHWLFSYADPDLMRPGADPTDPAEHIKTWTIIYEEFRDYFSKVTTDRRACPRDDIASMIANAEIDGCPMTERALISYYIILSTAGHDTTAATTAMGMWLLTKRPDLLARLKAQPRDIARFVEEAIRWTTPVKHFVRSAVEDYQLAGQHIAKGDLLYLSFASANRDDTVFDDPYCFDIDRNPNRHLGFGFGDHVCIGQHLARLEMRLFWEELIPRLHSVEMAGELRISESEFVCGPKSVPINFVMDSE